MHAKRTAIKKAHISGKKKLSASKVSEPSSSDLATPLVHRINVLLHTMGSIEQREQQLCTLMTEVRNRGAVTPEAREELLALLDQMPHQEYAHDLEAVLDALR